MKNFNAALLLLACLFTCPSILKAQEIDISVKVRGTGFYGNFGQTYSAIGYEPGITIMPSEKPWAGGLSYSQNLLGYDANSDLEVEMNLVNFHLGAKGKIGRHIHPFAYALLGLRFMSYENPAVPSESDPLFTSFSLGYGARTGIQIGGGRWRFEGNIEYMTGTNSKYLTPESFEKATDSGKSYRDFMGRSPISGLSVGAGVTYVLNLGSTE